MAGDDRRQAEATHNTGRRTGTVSYTPLPLSPQTVPGLEGCQNLHIRIGLLHSYVHGFSEGFEVKK